MTLFHRTDFALLILLFMAVQGGCSVTSAEIVRIFGTPINHLVKVDNEHSRRENLWTIRGPGEGVAKSNLALSTGSPSPTSFREFSFGNTTLSIHRDEQNLFT